MPFYIRKAISFGPIRFNLSKSGVGVSAGVKGLRLGSGPAGNYIHAGRHGLYYKKFFSSGKGASNKSNQNNSNANFSGGHETIIDSGSVLDMVDSKFSHLIDEINEKNKLLSYFPISLTIAILINIYVYVEVALSGLFGELWTAAGQLILIISSSYLCYQVYKKDYFRKKTILLFELDEDLKQIYEELYDSIEYLNTSKKISNVFKSTDIYDSKYHAGAGQLIDKKDIRIVFKNPQFLKTNIDPPCFPAGKESLYFLPTTLLVSVRGVVGAVAYKDLKVELSTIRFIEDGNVPSDANIVDTTWEKVNKDGSPDRRFSSNRQLPVVQYDVLKLFSDSGLNEMFYISKNGIAKSFIDNIKIMKKYYGHIPSEDNDNYESDNKYRNSGNQFNDSNEKGTERNFEPNYDSENKKYGKILGLKGKINKSDIHKAYKKKMKEYHPDKVSTMADEFKELALKRTKEINEAYEYFKKKYGE
jgi:hypothetical protein